jgi:hypothetical protein
VVGLQGGFFVMLSRRLWRGTRLLGSCKAHKWGVGSVGRIDLNNLILYATWIASLV